MTRSFAAGHPGRFYFGKSNLTASSKIRACPTGHSGKFVNRTGNDLGTAGSVLGQPATFQMVLDGQQRVQSLILALGDDQWGFQLYDADWALDLQDRRVKPSGHWSKASLCIDLQKFEAELRTKNDTVRKVEVGKISGTGCS